MTVAVCVSNGFKRKFSSEVTIGDGQNVFWIFDICHCWSPCHIGSVCIVNVSFLGRRVLRHVVRVWCFRAPCLCLCRGGAAASGGARCIAVSKFGNLKICFFVNFNRSEICSVRFANQSKPKKWFEAVEMMTECVRSLMCVCVFEKVVHAE